VGDSAWTDELTELHDREAGSDHYIDIASRRHALACVKRWTPARGVIMDIGCSSGHMLRLLQAHLSSAQIIGADYICGPLEKLAGDLPSIPLLQFDLTVCPLEDRILDCITALNVLEHIGDDREAVRQMFRLLKPGGHAIVEVPAGPGLYDIYDEQLMHHRRYRLKHLVSLFEQVGFKVLDASHLGFFLFPAFWLVKKLNKRFLTASTEEKRHRVASNIRTAKQSALMNTLMRMEAGIGGSVRYPFGIRCVLVAERPR